MASAFCPNSSSGQDGRCDEHTVTTRPGKLSPDPGRTVLRVRWPQRAGHRDAERPGPRSVTLKASAGVSPTRSGAAASGRGAAAMPKPSASWLRAPPHPLSPAVLRKGPRDAEHASRPGCSPDAPEVPPSIRSRHPGSPIRRWSCGCFCHCLV